MDSLHSPRDSGRWHRSVPPFVGGLYLASVPIFNYSEYLNAYGIPQILIGLLLVIVLLRGAFLHEGIVLPVSTSFFFLWIVFAGATLVGFGRNPFDGDLFMTTGKVVLSTVLLANIPRRLEDLRTIATILALACPIVFIINGSDIVRLFAIFQSGTLSDADRFAGTLANANTAAWFGVMSAWSGVMLILISRRPLRWGATIVVALGIVLIVISGSRKGLLAIPISVAIFYFVLYFRVRGSGVFKTLASAGIMVLLLGLFFALLASPFGHRLEVVVAGDSESSADSRWDMATAGLRLFSENPLFGIGFDRYRYESWRYGAVQGAYSHSTPVEVLANTGIIGLLLYSASFFWMFRELLQARKQGSNKSERLWFGGSICLVVLFAWFSLFSVSFEDKLTWPLLGAFLGYATHRTRSSLPGHRQRLRVTLV